MIGSLKGIIVSKSPPQLSIEVAGVGYDVEAPMSTFYALPAVGQSARILTHLVVRDDAHILYGFATDAERALFRSLIKVSGVGPRIALAILSGVSIDAFIVCVQQQDSATLIKIPGVGRKIAERLVIEMRDRVGATLTPNADSNLPPGSPAAEAFHAMVALGYKGPEATRLLQAAGPGTQSTEEIIRRALQRANRE
ncbi:MAG: Holliday junction branch migration protein RuvA [Steroidobacteraceae bacterium]